MYQDESSLPDNEAIGLLEIGNNDLDAQHQNLEFENSQDISKFTEEKPILSPEAQQELNDLLINAIKRHRPIEDVESLLSQGADANARNNYGAPALIIAANEDNTNAILALIAAKADVNAKNEDELTALIYAAYKNYTEAILTLIKAGADVNVKDDDGRTALIYAANWENLEATLALIEAGADFNAKADDGRTALICAAYRHNFKILRNLIKAGAEVNTKTNSGDTALIYAANWENLEATLDLIEAGADVNAKNDRRETALSISIPEIHSILTAHKERLNEIAAAIEQDYNKTITLNNYERRKLVIDATNFNKDNIIEALVYKLAKDEVVTGRTANAPIDNRAEEKRIQAIRNDIYSPHTPERLGAITATVNKVLEKYKLLREQDLNRIRLICSGEVSQNGEELKHIELPAEITATIASYLPEEQPGDRRSDRGALRVAALSNKKAREAYRLGESTSKQESSGRGFRR